MSARPDHVAIASRVAEGARVLDVGCADGALMELLRDARRVQARGLEMSQEGARAALAKGLSVMHGNADTELATYPDDTFDVAILSKTIQEMRQPGAVLKALSRIAPEIILSFRNYGYWKRRFGLLVTGRMPAPKAGSWHEAAALHPCTVADMVELASSQGLSIIAMAAVNEGRVTAFRPNGLARLNWEASEAILHLRRG